MKVGNWMAQEGERERIKRKRKDRRFLARRAHGGGWRGVISTRKILHDRCGLWGCDEQRGRLYSKLFSGKGSRGLLRQGTAMQGETSANHVMLGSYL